jgi:DNA adenine methylase
MSIANSPLRYPGGKQILGRLIAHLIRLNGSVGGTYAEPYAGGAGVALGLLFGEHVGRVLINDADPCVFAFWKSILFNTDKFVDLLQRTPTTIREWECQREIYQHPMRSSQLRRGFATFYLNRCNRSGIIASGGPIGGKNQTGRWKIDARFNRDELERRIRRIAMYADRIIITNKDAVDFIRTHVQHLGAKEKPFVYLDPPYFEKGRDLYLNYYTEDDHARLAEYVANLTSFPWVMSYDNVPEIARLYTGFRQLRFSLDYSARERRQGSEIMISRYETVFPSAWIRSIPRRFITSSEDAPAIPMG